MEIYPFYIVVEVMSVITYIVLLRRSTFFLQHEQTFYASRRVRRLLFYLFSFVFYFTSSLRGRMRDGITLVPRSLYRYGNETIVVKKKKNARAWRRTQG